MRSRIREVRVWHLITYALLPPVIVLIARLSYVYVGQVWLEEQYLALYIVACILISYFCLRRFLIGLVLVYKAFAPSSLREGCRFEPTCSTYMILAIKKYGVVVGLIKGILRILRCKPPNGGIDEP